MLVLFFGLLHVSMRMQINYNKTSDAMEEIISEMRKQMSVPMAQIFALRRITGNVREAITEQR